MDHCIARWGHRSYRGVGERDVEPRIPPSKSSLRSSCSIDLVVGRRARVRHSPLQLMKGNRGDQEDLFDCPQGDQLPMRAMLVHRSPKHRRSTGCGQRRLYRGRLRNWIGEAIQKWVHEQGRSTGCEQRRLYHGRLGCWTEETLQKLAYEQRRLTRCDQKRLYHERLRRWIG